MHTNTGLDKQLENLGLALKALDEAILYYGRYKGTRSEPQEVGRGDIITDTLAQVRTKIGEIEKLRYSQWQAWNEREFWTGAVFFVDDNPDQHFYCTVFPPDRKSNMPYITEMIYNSYFQYRFPHMKFATNSVGYEIAIVRQKTGRRIGVIQPSAKKAECEKWNRENGIFPKK